MSNIKIVYTRLGMMIGDFTENADTGTYTVANPALINIGQNSVSLLPFLAITQESSVRLNSDDIFLAGSLFTPAIEILNHYNQQFGSGIEVVSRLN